MTPAQWRLLALLSVATFFEGFDFLALSQILPSLSAEFGLDPSGTGWVIAVCNVGTLFSWGLVRIDFDTSRAHEPLVGRLKAPFRPIRPGNA